MKFNRALILACLVGSIGGSLFAAEPAPEAKPEPTAPAAEATEAKKDKITMDEARAIAIAKVPGGKMATEELGRVGGKLTYFFDITTEGQKGLDVVAVDAADGTVISVTHKSEWAARRDAKEKRRKRE